MSEQYYELEPGEFIVAYRLQLQSSIAKCALYLAKNPNLSEAHEAYNQVIRDVLQTDEELRTRYLSAPLVERTMEDVVRAPILRLVRDDVSTIQEFMAYGAIKAPVAISDSANGVYNP